jgi:hypothetical protein
MHRCTDHLHHVSITQLTVHRCHFDHSPVSGVSLKFQQMFSRSLQTLKGQVKGALQVKLVGEVRRKSFRTNKAKAVRKRTKFL